MQLIDDGKENLLREIVCEYDAKGQERILNAAALNKRAFKKYNYLETALTVDLKLSDIDQTDNVKLKAYYSTWFGINKSQPLGLLIGMKLSKDDIPQIYVDIVKYAKRLSIC